jgi:hypothetical protein
MALTSSSLPSGENSSPKTLRSGLTAS